jgi:hypothetical protein
MSGLQGSIIVADEDGFQIIDDTDLVENSEKQLIILTDAQDGPNAICCTTIISTDKEVNCYLLLCSI